MLVELVNFSPNVTYICIVLQLHIQQVYTREEPCSLPAFPRHRGHVEGNWIAVGTAAGDPDMG